MIQENKITLQGEGRNFLSFFLAYTEISKKASFKENVPCMELVTCSRHDFIRFYSMSFSNHDTMFDFNVF